MASSDFAALSTAQIVAFTTAQFSEIATDDIAALSTTQVVAIETADIAALSTAAIVALTTEQVVALTTDQIAALTTEQLAAMESADVAVLTTAQFVAISTLDIASFTTSQIAALTTLQLANLTTEQEDAFTATQIQAMSSDQINALALSSPLVLDLNGDGLVNTLSLKDGVYFDLNATDEAIKTGWVSSEDGLLVFDRNQDGSINDGSELFGTSFTLADGSKASDGFEALSSLDSNADGVLNASDDSFSSLQVWRDLDADGVSDSGELFSLSQLGISEIEVNAKETAYLDDGNYVGLEASYKTVDGAVHSIADVWFKTDPDAVALDLTQVDPDTVAVGSLSQIDLSAVSASANQLTLNAQTVSELGQVGLADTGGDGQEVQMIVKGGSHDTVILSDEASAWQDAGTTQIEGETYKVYQDGDIQLLVAADVHLLLS